jgi:hypothetical protein
MLKNLHNLLVVLTLKPFAISATLYRKFETNISRNETARPLSQFLLSVSHLYIPTIGPPILRIFRLRTYRGNI